MLVLSRKIGEIILITMTDGRPIEIEVVGIDRQKVRIGVTAPEDVSVNRSEVQDRIDAEKPA